LYKIIFNLTMKVNCKYFGSIAELTNISEEWIEMNSGESISDLDIHLKNKYPNLYFTNYRIALNQQLNGGEKSLQDSDEVALLPPFGGG